MAKVDVLKKRFSYKLSVHALLVLAVLSVTLGASGDVGPGPSMATMRILNSWHYFLEIIKDKKGRYPKTLKEIRSFKDECNFGVICQEKMKYSDGWDVPLKYSSDGKTYRLSGSHDFFLTEKTKKKGPPALYWDNSSSPPVDPPPREDTL